MQVMLVVFLPALVTVLSVFLSRRYRRNLQENTVTDINPTSSTYNGDAGDRWVHRRGSLSVIASVRTNRRGVRDPSDDRGGKR